MNPTLTLESIPHRAPFLFVDEIAEVSENRILTRKFVDPQCEFFRGHYPGRPVMPGVLICECCVQAGALLIAHAIGAYDPSKGVPVLTRILEARFKRMVQPGQTLWIEAILDDQLDGAYFMTGRVTVDGKPALRVGFVCMLAKNEESAA